MERRRAAMVVVALALLVAARHPTASIRIETHDLADVTPRRIAAAVDLGLVAVDVMVTWSEHIAR